ncbi:MAG: SDR family oxidoreductase [Pseudomonadota bacterium]
MAVGTALVTGGSSGIGRALAELHAKRGGDLVITARRAEPLDDLKRTLEERHGVSVRTITQDLSAPDGPEKLYEQIRSDGITLDVLINNAGFGGRGVFHQQDLQHLHTMVDLNIRAVMTLTHMVLGDMVARRKGRILMVGSTAGMVPGPLQATYHATKAFVNSFSQALAEEVKDSGVTVTVLAPGAVDTEFMERAGMSDAKGLQQGGMADAADVARVGYEAMMRGDLVAINDPRLKLGLEWVAPLLPRRALLRMMRNFTEKADA